MKATDIRRIFWWRLLVGAGAAWTAVAVADNTRQLPVPGPLFNRVYKCAGPAGAPLYQDSPCADGALLRDFAADPANVSVLPTSRPLPSRTDEYVDTKPAGQPIRRPRASLSEYAEAHANTKLAGRPIRRSRESSSEHADARAKAHTNAEANAHANERRNLRPGMTEGEILARVGRPDLKGAGQDRKARARWTYLPAAGDPQTVTTIALENGKAVAIDRTVAR